MRNLKAPEKILISLLVSKCLDMGTINLEMRRDRREERKRKEKGKNIGEKER